MRVKKLKSINAPLPTFRSVNTRQFTIKMDLEMISVSIDAPVDVPVPVPVDVPLPVPVDVPVPPLPEKKRGRPVDEAKRAAKAAATAAAKAAEKAEKEAAKAEKAQQKEAEKEAKAAAKKATKEAKATKAAKEAKDTVILNPEEPTDQDQKETIRALQTEVETLRAQLAAIKAIVC